MVDPLPNELAALQARVAELEQIRETLLDDLEQSEARYQGLLQVAPLAVVIHRAGKIVYLNQAALQLIGATHATELIGRNVLDFAHPDNQPAILARIQALQLEGQSVVPPTHEKFVRLDGSIIDVEVAGSSITYANQPAIQLAIRDLSEMLRVQKVEHGQLALAEALRDSAAALNSTLQLTEVFERILANVGRVVSHDSANIMLIQEGALRLVRARGHGNESINRLMDWFNQQIVSVQSIPNFYVMVQEQEPTCIPDTRIYPNWQSFPETEWIQGYLGAPIIIDGVVSGFLNLNSATPNMFTPTDAQHLQLFADQAALAIKNARLFEAEREQNLLAETLRDVTLALVSQHDLAAVLDEILRQAQRLIPYTAANIALIEGEMLVVAGTLGYSDGIINSPTVPSRRWDSRTLDKEAITSRKPVIVMDTALDPRWQATGHFPWRSFIAVPIAVHNEVMGLLRIHHNHPAQFTTHDVAKLQPLANAAAIAVQNARLYEQERTQRHFAEALRDTAQALTTSLNLTDVMDNIIEYVGRVVANDNAHIMLVHNRRAYSLRTRDQSGYNIERWSTEFDLPVDDFFTMRYMTQHRKALVIPDTTEHPEWRMMEGTRWVRAYIGAPIIIDDTVIGFLHLDSKTPRAYRAEDGARLQTFANQAAIAIQNAQLYEQVQHYADELEQRVQERTQELQAANEHLMSLGRVKDEFVANVSHELRTPLSSIIINHEMLVQDPANQALYIGRLKRETERLRMLIEDLLRLSRLDQGRVHLSLEAIDINRLLQIYVTDRTPLAQQRAIHLTCETHPDLPPVMADREQIGQVISILLTNALNYIQVGGEVALIAQAGEGWVGFAVKDNGPGILPEEFPNLFTRFFRGTAGKASGAPGTGLGLAIAKEIIERHHGRIEVDSTPNQGTTFKVWLPNGATGLVL